MTLKKTDLHLALAGLLSLGLAGAAPTPNNYLCANYKRGNCQNLPCQAVAGGFCNPGVSYNTIDQAPTLLGSCYKQAGGYCNPDGQVPSCNTQYFDLNPGQACVNVNPVCEFKAPSPGC